MATLTQLYSLLVHAWHAIPPEMRAIIAWTFAALVVAGVKSWLGDPMPTDGPLRRRLFQLLHVSDVLLVNTEPVRLKALRTGASLPPPPDDKTTKKKLRVPLFVLALSIGVAGCAGAPVQSATIAQAVAPSISAIHDAIAKQIERERIEILASTSDPKVQADALEDMLERYEPLRTAYAALAEAFFRYVEAIRDARAQGRSDVPASLLSALRDAWSEVLARAAPLKIPIPVPHGLEDALEGLL